MKKSKFCILLSIFFFFSCNEENDLSLNEIDNILDTFEEYVSNDNHSSDYIYDQNKLHRFDLYLSDENLEKINSDPAAENYVEGSLVFENENDHIWWFCFDDINNRLIASKKNQIIDPFITVSMAKLLEKVFRESLVIELAWEEKIDYRIDNKIRNDNFKKISFLKLIRKYLSKKIRTALK